MDCLRGKGYWVRSKIGRFWCTEKRGCLLTYPSWEKEVKRAIRTYADDGLFLDVGANIGVLSVFAGKQGMRVLAMEPNPEIFAALEKNLEENHVKGSAMNYAAWSSVCQLKLKKEKNPVMDSISPDGEIPIYGVTIDSLGLWPQIVKVDVEGSTMQVFKGMSITLDRVHPVLIYESYLGSEPAQCRGFLSAYGYEVEKLDRINWLAS